jgi:phosphohistidine phosphatase
MQILLLRHGDAHDNVDDASRALSPVGNDQATIAGTVLQSLLLIPELILTSPLLRAVQTAYIVADIVGVKNVMQTEYLTPGSDHRQIFQQLNELRRDRILLVGHEPHLSTMISLLVAGSRSAHIDMRKGTLASLEAVDSVGPATAILRWILPPEVSMRLSS